MYQMYQRASSFWLKYYKICTWKWALLRSLILNGFGGQKFIKKASKSFKRVIRNRLEKTIDFETDFQSILDRFWVQFKIALPLEPSQEHVMMGPDFVINSPVSPMVFLKDVSNKSTTFASKKTAKLMLKMCKKIVFTLHRDFSTLIRLTFYPKYVQDRQEASKRSPRCLHAASNMALAVLCKTPKSWFCRIPSIKNQVF